MDKLGFRSKNKSKSGILLEILPLNARHNYVHPYITSISLYVPFEVVIDEIKKAIMNYTALRQHD